MPPGRIQDAIRTPGGPLDESTRRFMEPRFGHDFANVRVHTGRDAMDSVDMIGARAYTIGSDIFFGANEYAPGSGAGRLLLAHELAHVVQQAAGRSSHVVQRQTSTDEPRVPQYSVTSSLLPLPTGSTPGRFGVTASLPMPGLLVGARLSPADMSSIELFMTLHRFSVGPRLAPSLDGAPTTLDAVVDLVRPLVSAGAPRADIERVIRARWSQLVLDALLRPATRSVPPNPIVWTVPPPSAAPPASAAPITLTAGVNYAWHVNLDGPRGTSSDRTLQLQFGEDAPLQRVFQISYNIDTGQTQVLVGGQATQDIDLVKGLLKLSFFAQVLAGVASTGTSASGRFAVAQPSAGAQLTLTFGPVQLAVQAAPSITLGAGQQTTGDMNTTLQGTIRF